MSENIEPGILITIEGGEGVGKTTATRNLVKALNARGVAAISSKEPGRAFNGAVREILMGGADHKRPTKAAELLLYLADRAEHVETVVKPALEAGISVVMDRFYDSTLVYQCLIRGFDERLVEKLHDDLMDCPIPDVTFILDADPEVASARVASRNDGVLRLGQRDGFQDLVIMGFRTLLGRGYKNHVRVDANNSPDEVLADILAVLDPMFPERAAAREAELF